MKEDFANGMAAPVFLGPPTYMGRSRYNISFYRSEE